MSSPAIERLSVANETDTTHDLSMGLDYYKPTMSQLIYEYEPDAEVTFTFKNRGHQRLLDYIDAADLQETFDKIQARGWTEHELRYLGGLAMSDGSPVYSDAYLQHLRDSDLPRLNVQYDEAKDDLALDTTGDWSMVTFWETVAMSQVNQAYFENYLVKNGLNPMDVYDEGDRRLSKKIDILKANPGIKFADFGTRRHFSLQWQAHVIERLMAECPDNFVGTSNVGLAAKYGIKPIGTFAHEMIMTYTALADARGEDISQAPGKFLDDWYDLYGTDLSTALTDTFGSKFFFEDFTPEQARKWNGVRHDSGDPFEFGERVISFYDNLDIDPHTKTIVFSDGLDIDMIVKLYNTFNGRINIIFGWGTTLTNDMGIKALNVVMKATHARDTVLDVEADGVKLSDDAGKHTGPEALVGRYQQIFG